MANRNKPGTEVEEVEQAVETVQPESLPDEKDAIIASLKAQIQQMQAGAPKAPQAPTVASAETKPGAAWEEYIDVIVPRHGRGQEKSIYVAVNGRNALIPADGKMQHIRKPLAYALLMALEDEAKAEQFAEDLPHDAAPGSFAELMSVINQLKATLREHGISVN